MKQKVQSWPPKSMDKLVQPLPLLSHTFAAGVRHVHCKSWSLSGIRTAMKLSCNKFH